MIQESGFFYPQKRRDHAKRNSKIYGLDLVFLEYQLKKIKEYENENNFWCDTELPSKVFRQYNAYWVPDNQALLNHFLKGNGRSPLPLKDEAKKSSTSFPKGAGACVKSLTSIAGNPYGVNLRFASQVGQTTELFDKPERFVFES